MTGRTVAVMGFGVTGRAVARRLLAEGDQVVVWDDQAVSGAGVLVESTPGPGELGARLAAVDLLVPSPGVPLSHPVYAEAERLGLPVWAEIELAARALEGMPRPKLVAITGTNGKTTVTTLVTAMLERSGLLAVAAGNIGLPLIEAVTSEADVVVAEVSSFQLQFSDSFRPSVSCWLNLAADHLDWHPSGEHYARAKARIWANQAGGDTAVVNADDAAVVATASGPPAVGGIPSGVARLDFSTRQPADYSLDGSWLIGRGGARLIEVGELPRALPHDVANSLAACAVTVAAGGTVEGCRAGLRETPPLPHRVALIGAGGDVAWYDDSKATTPASVLAAVAGFDSVVLIAGGRNKGLDLGALRSTVPPVHSVVAIGDAAPEVFAAFDGLVPVATAASMEAAVEAAGAAARPGDAVLLSPGCASFDWYPSYAARGDHFTSIVQSRLAGRESAC